MRAIIRTFVVDDQELVRSGICFTLAGLPNIKVVGQAASGQEALKVCAKLKPNLVLLDLKIADMDGMTLAMALLKLLPDIKILVVTSSLDNSLIPQLFDCGIRGFFNKSDGHEELLKAIQLVYSGRIYICPRVAKKFKIEAYEPESRKFLGNPLDMLSERELQVVLLLAYGLSQAEICNKLAITNSTLKTYWVRISEKLHVKNDVELIILATRYGLFAEASAP